MLNYFSGSVAQVVEQGTHKPLVAGSTPAAATYCFPGEFLSTDCEYLVNHVTIWNSIAAEGE